MQKNKKWEEKKEKNKIMVFDPKKSSTKVLLLLGTTILCLLSILIMKHFFIDKSFINTNYSTDRKLVYIQIEGQEELIATQKYISTLGYDMRYDIERFKVFRYKNHDVFKSLDDENVLIMVEKAILPGDCNSVPLEKGYNNCYKIIDKTSEEYYISYGNRVYRILIKTPGGFEYEEGVKKRINYMINTFEILENEG